MDPKGINWPRGALRFLCPGARARLTLGPKEKDLVDPPALSRIRHFIKRKIAYDLKQIQYTKTVFRYPPQVGFEASWR